MKYLHEYALQINKQSLNITLIITYNIFQFINENVKIPSEQGLIFGIGEKNIVEN